MRQYGVYVIVDPEFGFRLRDIPEGEPIWIVDTGPNREVLEAIRKERKLENHLNGVTAFKIDPKMSHEDWLIAELDTIDLHHGEMSHDPPWSVINVIGTPWTERVQDELTKFGFKEHEDTANGFIGKK